LVISTCLRDCWGWGGGWGREKRRSLYKAFYLQLSSTKPQLLIQRFLIETILHLIVKGEIQHCSICCPSASTVSEDVGIESNCDFSFDSQTL
jgi:hypothetical protein